MSTSLDFTSRVALKAKASVLNGTHATIDFETRAKLPIKVGAYKYAMDRDTSVLCLAYRLPGSKIKIWHPFQDEEPEDLLAWVAAGGIVEAHSAEFEYCIWNYICVKRMGWPRLSIEQLRCSAAKAAALALPRGLEELGLALKSKVQKDMAGRRLMLRMSKPRKPVKRIKANPKAVSKLLREGRKGEDPDGVYWNEEFEDLERLFEYCQTDVTSEEHASEAIDPLDNRNLKTYQLTQKMNERGIYCDLELCKTAVRFASQYKEELESKLQELTGGEIKTAKQTAKILEFASAYGEELPNLQAATVALVLSKDELHPKLRSLLEIRQALAKSSITKYQTMIAMAGPDSRIRGTLLFHGASTGRFSGRGIQPQNYVKSKIKDVENVFEVLKLGDYEFFKFIFGDVFAGLANGLRGMLCAPPGKILYNADFNAIEARVVLWLADDQDNLGEYLRGDDPYKHMAAVIYNKTYGTVEKLERELGKRAVLGCGFGMGVNKFHVTCETQGFPISKETAKLAVRAYRAKHPKVKALWYELERAAMSAVRSPGQVFKVGHLQWRYSGGYLFCRLPSGRKIAYASPVISPSKFTYEVEEEINGEMVSVEHTVEKDGLSYMAVDAKTKKWVRERTYGGKLTENVVQAVAADLMIDAMFRVNASGYPVIFTVHDEIICETPENFGSLEDFEKIMSVVPKWAPGIPIKVEGYREKRYKK